MKRLLIPAFLFVCCVTAFAQVKPRIAILPFTGGQAGDGDTVATLLSYQAGIMEAFTVLPKTNAVIAEVYSEDFQLAGFTDTDTTAGIGRMLNADFVVSGFIRHVVDRNILVTTVTNVNTMELVAGDYREYHRIDEIPSQLPDLSRMIINASRKDSSGLPKLVMALWHTSGGLNLDETAMLAQIFAVELANSGKYALIPRVSSGMQTGSELTRRGIPPEDLERNIGLSLGADSVLVVSVRSTGTTVMFDTSIIDAKNGSAISEASRTYYSFSNGIIVMPELARIHTGLPARSVPSVVMPAVPVPVPLTVPVPEPVSPPPVRVEPPPAARPEPVSAPPPVIQVQAPEEPVPAPAPIHVDPAPETPPAEEERGSLFGDPSRLWTAGVSAGSALTIPWLIATPRVTLAPVRYSFLELGCDFGFLSMDEGTDYLSFYPFAHYCFYLPFGAGGFYIGAGAGYMMANYSFAGEGDLQKQYLAFDAVAGFNLFDFLDISYTARTRDFEAISGKVSIGYTYRFNQE